MPVIAALNGLTLGGGAEIALACDIRFMDKSARIGFPEVKLGVFPGSGGVFRLPRLLGAARAYELLYSGDLIDAREAHRIGLINRLTPVGEALSGALAFAETIAQRPALALSLIRAGVRDSLTQTTKEATDRTLADSHLVFTGPDIEEGLAAFFAKRQPAFTAGRNDARKKCGGDKEMTNFLAGIKVVSLTHYLQGPACVQFLADLGADVVKIERIGGAYGDTGRAQRLS